MIRLHCVVENSAKRSSTLWGEHGLSFWIEAPGEQVLFDTGQSGEVFLHNAQALGLHLKRIDALAVSHAHYDHTGGFEHVLPRMRSNVPLYAIPDLFRERFSRYEGEYRSIGLRMSREAVEEYANLRLSAEPAEVIPGVWTSGPTSRGAARGTPCGRGMSGTRTPKRTCAEPEIVETEEFLAMLRFERRNELQELMVET